jgi:hypothetical protein
VFALQIPSAEATYSRITFGLLGGHRGVVAGVGFELVISSFVPPNGESLTEAHEDVPRRVVDQHSLGVGDGQLGAVESSLLDVAVMESLPHIDVYGSVLLQQTAGLLLFLDFWFRLLLLVIEGLVCLSLLVAESAHIEGLVLVSKILSHLASLDVDKRGTMAIKDDDEWVFEPVEVVVGGEEVTEVGEVVLVHEGLGDFVVTENVEEVLVETVLVQVEVVDCFVGADVLEVNLAVGSPDQQVGLTLTTLSAYLASMEQELNYFVVVEVDAVGG